MVYLLLLVIVYSALAAVVYDRRPQSLTNRVLSLYIILILIVAVGALAVEAAASVSQAKAGARLNLAAWAAADTAVLPYVFLAFYFGHLFTSPRYGRVLRAAFMAAALLVIGCVYAIGISEDGPVMVLRDYGYGLLRPPSGSEIVSVVNLLSLCGVLVTLVILVVAMYKKYIAPRWMGWVFPLVILLSGFAHNALIRALGDAQTLNLTGSTLTYIPLVLFFIYHSIDVQRARPLPQMVKTLLVNQADGAFVLDSNNTLIWASDGLGRFLNLPPASTVTFTHMSAALGSSHLWPAIQTLLDNDKPGHVETTVQTILAADQLERTVRITLTMLDDVPGYGVIRLLMFEDITAAEVRRALSDRKRDILALSAVSEAIASSLDSKQIMDTALEHIFSITGAEASAIYLIQEETPDFLYLATAFKALDAFDIPPRLSVNDSLCGQAIQQGQPVVVQTGDQSAYLPAGSGRAMAAPLVARRRAIGALLVGDNTTTPFTGPEQALLEGIGRQLGVALDNARLHERERQMRRQSDTLREVAHIVSSDLDLDRSLNAILSQLKRVINYDSATVMLVNPNNLPEICAHIGFDATVDWDFVNRKLAESSIWPEITQTRQSVLIHDITAYDDWIFTQASRGKHAFIGTPMIARDEVIGTLNVYSTTPGAYDSKAVEVVEAFAEQVAVAVENGRLFSAETERRKRAELLHQISALLALPDDLDELLGNALDQLTDVIPYNGASVLLIDEDKARAAAMRGNQTDLQIVSFPVADMTLTSKLVEAGHAMIVDDLSATTSTAKSPIFDLGLLNWIGVPLITSEGMVGALNIHRTAAGSFTQDDLQVAQTLANYLAALIHNRRLLAQATARTRDLQTLNTIAAASAQSLRLDRLLNTVIAHVLEALEVAHCAIHLVGTATKTLQLAAHQSITPDSDDFVAQLADTCEQVWQTQSPVTLPPGTLCDHALVCVPLVATREVVGTLCVVGFQAQPLDPDTVTLLVGVGRAVGMAIANAQRYQNALGRERISEALAMLGVALGAETDPKAVLKMVARESASIFGVENIIIWLVDGETLTATETYGPKASALLGQQENLTLSHALEVRATMARRPLYENDLTEKPPSMPPDWRREIGICSQLVAPLLGEGEPVGAVGLLSTTNDRSFGPADLEAVNLLAVQAGLALQNALQAAEVRRRLRFEQLVNEVGRHATAILTIKDLIHAACRQIYQAFGYDTIALFLSENDTPTPRAAIIAGLPTDPADLDPVTLAMHAVERAIEKRQAVLISAGLRIRRDLRDSAGRTDLAVPLIMGTEVIGVLAISRQQIDAIGDSEKDIMQTLADQLAISISNARLFDEVRRHTDELESRVVERTAEIAAQKEQTEAILRSVADAVIVTDLDGAIVQANPPAQRLLETSHTANTTRQWVSELAGTPDAGKERALDTRFYQATASPVVQGGRPTGTVIVLRDITRLHELDRLKSKFVSTVSHELRTPLTNIKLYVSLLKRGRAERHTHYLNVTERETERLDQLVRDLLDLSRLEGQNEPPKREWLDIGSVIQVVLDNHAALAEIKNIPLRHEPTHDLPRIHADRNQLIQVLTNLVGNAIAYTDAGYVCVRAKPITYRDQDAVRIEVEDTGVGIPDEDLPHIFERFYRGDNAGNRPGTGLGLAIVSEIINLHYGKIEAHSTINKGTTFYITLPTGV
jgi:GAF domain-containing protein